MFLEDKLIASGTEVEVINLAYKGLNSVGEAAVLEHIGWSFKPDIVLLQYLLNDPLPSLNLFFAERMDWQSQCIIPLAVFKSLHDILDRHCYLYSFLNAEWRDVMGRILGKEDLSYADLHHADYSGWKKGQAALIGIQQECLRRNVKFLMMMFPSLPRTHTLDENYMYAELDQTLSDFASHNGIVFFNVRPGIAKVNPRAASWRARIDDGHPSPQFNEVVAGLIAQKLSELGWLAREHIRP
jgi:hypothetical protein